MYHGLSLSNSRDIIANYIGIIQGNVVTDILDLIAANSADTNAIITALLADQTFLNAIAAAATNSYTKTESDTLFYTKTYLNTALSGKVDVSTLNSYYTKTEIDTNIYTKTQIDTNIYTKTQSDNLINVKQNYINDGDLTIAKTNGLQTALDNKVDDTQVSTNVPANALFTDTKTQIYNGNGFYDLSKIHFINGTLALESTSNSPYFGSWGIEINHGIANITGLQSALDLKRNISDSYTKTELDTTFLDHYLKTESDNLFYTKTYLNNALLGKVDVSTLNSYYTKTQVDTTFTSYYTKTQVDSTFTNYYLQSHIDNNFYNKTYIDALTHAQIKYNNNYVDLEYLDFADTVITTGSNSNEYILTSNPQMTNVQGLTAALLLKRDVSDSYGKTHIDDELALKANQNDLLSIYNGSSFSQITQLTMYNSNVTISGTSAFVTPDALEVYKNGAWVASRALKFTNCSVISQGSATPVHLEITPNYPTIAQVESGALTTELAGKQPNLLIAGNGTGFTGAVQKLNFPNCQLALTPSTGEYALTAQPHFDDISFSYGSTLNATSYTSKTSFWWENATSNLYSATLHIDEVGNMVNNANGSNVTATETITYTIPAQYIGKSVYLNHMAYYVGGYVDVYICKSTNSDETLTCRLSTHSAISGSSNSNYHGVRVDCIASGYDGYDQIKIKCRKGLIYIMGLGFTMEKDRPVATNDWTHSDNIIGDPSSLSDTRIKQNQEIASQYDLCNIFDEIEPKVYDRIEHDESNATEHRLGFIADDVKRAINTHMPDITNIISERPVGDENLLALDYSRLVCVLWAKVKQLEQRLSVLKNI